MVDQNKILALYAKRQRCSLDEICCALDPKKGAPVGTSLRRNIIGALGRLAARGLIQRERKAAVYGNPGATYQLTKSGTAFVASGKRVTSGPTRANTGVRNRPSGMRQRIWEALRLKRRATLVELVELIHDEDDPETGKVTDNARKYLTGLSRAGIVTELAVRAKGYAPTSNGFKRFALVRDLGPKAPAIGRAYVTDHNAADSDAKRIPYKEGAQ